MWEKYELGASRPVSIPSDLMRAIDKYKERTGVQNPEVFDTALLRLWNVWNVYVSILPHVAMVKAIYGYPLKANILLDGCKV